MTRRIEIGTTVIVLQIPTLLREKKLLSEEEIARIFSPEFLAGQAD